MYKLLILYTAIFSLSAHASVPRPHDEPEDTERSNAKQNYNLFDPAPLSHLRDFHPDRPGSTNSPYTIDAGHFQLETELVNYSHSRDGSVDQTNYPNPNLRAGITNFMELDLAWVPALTSLGTSGMGDLNIKLKRNMFGNDGGAQAWAIMPGVKIPTNTHSVGNNKWEPFFMLPLSFTLKNKWAISLMPEFDLRKNAANNGMHTEFVSPFTFGHHLFGMFDGYAEFVSHSSNDVAAAWLNYFGLGAVARIAANMQLDVGINLGLNAATPAFNPFAGWVIRL